MSIQLVPAPPVACGLQPESLRVADFETIAVGTEARCTKIIQQQDLEAFAAFSGDHNPLHMESEFARRTHFQKRVVHGMLLASYVSALVGMHCPGPGALWTEQSFRWPAPVFVGDSIEITLRVTHRSGGSRSLAVAIKATNQYGRTVMEGEGTVTLIEERRQTPCPQVSERVALVTSGARGLGPAIASALAEGGAAVLIPHQRESAAEAVELCEKLTAAGGRAIAVEAHPGNSTSLGEALSAARKAFGRPVDVLVNDAAAMPQLKSFAQMNWTDLQAALETHLHAAFSFTQAVVPEMMSGRSGCIVNIGSSLAWNSPPANWTSTLVATSALKALTRCLAAELGPYGIRVNMVSPGMVEIESLAVVPERLRKVQAMQTPLRRLAQPEDVGRVVVSLCSPAGEFITGADIPVCGGLQM